MGWETTDGNAVEDWMVWIRERIVRGIVRGGCLVAGFTVLVSALAIWLIGTRAAFVYAGIFLSLASASAWRAIRGWIDGVLLCGAARHFHERPGRWWYVESRARVRTIGE